MQRGAKEAPRPTGDTTANDPGATQVTPTSTKTGVGIVDPTTGTVFSQDGPPFVLDNTNLVAQTFGPTAGPVCSWLPAVPEAGGGENVLSPT